MADKQAAEKKKKSAYKYANTYDISGDSFKRKNKSCPKCGAGTFMAKHKDRWTCGKCGYMERQ
ncbi:30S ribosomal protein S27ae [Candidatus Woesearchaeota archaeon]|nr:30S ribosomal protein S27ae [Candidatus Woesearchaeota archaeon]